jgi:hypothetical protein
MSSLARPDDLRRWVDNQRAAATRERDEALRTGYVDDPVSAGLELMILAGGLYGWPIPKDDFEEREDEAEREAWRRLRERLGKR